MEHAPLKENTDKFNMNQALRVIQSYKFQKVNKGPVPSQFKDQ
jgi:hypothetical protein